MKTSYALVFLSFASVLAQRLIEPQFAIPSALMEEEMVCQLGAPPNAYSPPYDHRERTTHFLTVVLRMNPQWTLANLIKGTKSNSCFARSKGHLPLLVYHSQLWDAAKFHCKCMADHNAFQHETVRECCGRFNGDCSFSKRVWSFYRKNVAIGENLGQGFNDPFALVRAWIDSDGHCSNLVSSTHREMGIAFDRSYSCQSFGDAHPDQLQNPSLIIGTHVDNWPMSGKRTFFVVFWGEGYARPSRVWIQLDQSTRSLTPMFDASLGTLYCRTESMSEPFRTYFFRADRISNAPSISLRFPSFNDRLSI